MWGLDSGVSARASGQVIKISMNDTWYRMNACDRYILGIK